MHLVPFEKETTQGIHCFVIPSARCFVSIGDFKLAFLEHFLGNTKNSWSCNSSSVTQMLVAPRRRFLKGVNIQKVCEQKFPEMVGRLTKWMKQADEERWGLSWRSTSAKLTDAMKMAWYLLSTNKSKGWKALGTEHAKEQHQPHWNAPGSGVIWRRSRGSGRGMGIEPLRTSEVVWRCFFCVYPILPAGKPSRYKLLQHRHELHRSAEIDYVCTGDERRCSDPGWMLWVVKRCATV